MNIQIEPPLEARHKIGILIMVVAGIVACLLFNLWIEANLRQEASAWSARERTVNHGRR